MPQDEMIIEVLEDGSLKVSTDKVSMPNHVNAEGFIRAMAAQAGGAVSRTRKGHAHHGHSHSHGQDAHQH